MVIEFDKKTAARPTQAFANNMIWLPAGIRWRETLYGLTFDAVYFGVRLAGWDQHFPPRVELWLWRTSTLDLVALFVLYLPAISIGLTLTRTARPLCRMWFGKKLSGPLEVAASLPRWARLALHFPVIIIFVMARCHILVEGLISLRALPLVACMDVAWAHFVPPGTGKGDRTKCRSYLDTAFPGRRFTYIYLPGFDQRLCVLFRLSLTASHPINSE